MGLLIAASVFIVAFPQQAKTWSAVSAVPPTHQYILRQAFAQLETDQAFDDRNFPTLTQILDSEGVSNERLGGIAKGSRRPDVQKTVMDLDRYFNPHTNIPDNQKGVTLSYLIYNLTHD